MSDAPPYLDIALPSGDVLRIEPITAHSFRIRLSAAVLRMQPPTAHSSRVRLSASGSFNEPALIRYGILRRDWPPVTYEVDSTADGLTVRTPEAQLTCRHGCLTLKNAKGEILTYETAAPHSAGRDGFGGWRPRSVPADTQQRRAQRLES